MKACTVGIFFFLNKTDIYLKSLGEPVYNFIIPATEIEINKVTENLSKLL